MKHVVLALLFAAVCNHGSRAPAPAVATAPPAPAPSPGCYTPPVRADAGTVLVFGPTVFVGSDAPIDCSPGEHDEAAIYCAHVHDSCCASGWGWTCNNARYVDWYAEQCKR